MRVSELCKRPLVTCARDTTAREVAAVMRARHVGAVVVLDGAGRPAGIVTDRDLVVEVMAEAVDPDALLAEDVMAASPQTALDCESLTDAMWRMRAHGVRRLPVVDAAGIAIGMLAADDIAVSLAADLRELMQIAPAQREREARARAATLR